MGYAWVDNRVAGGTLAETDTEPCKHCQAVIAVGRKVSGPYTAPVASEERSAIAKAGGHCATCHGPLCLTCARACHEAGGVCIPFMKRIDQQWERMQRVLMIDRQRR